MIIGRFAPSPTGFLHLGHAYSALCAYENAVSVGGKLLLRIEDIDHARCRTEYELAIIEDLNWLGIEFEPYPIRQSDRSMFYAAAIKRLEERGLTYKCSCNRADIKTALSASQEGNKGGSMLYPGTCKVNGADPSRPKATRLDMQAAIAYLGQSALTFRDGYLDQDVRISAETLIHQHGDIVLARKDIGTSYHISVVVDDAWQKVTQVTRGEDMVEETAIHVLLQKLLGVATPQYFHHKLVRDENGKRLAKRYDAMAIRKFKQDGFSPLEVLDLARSNIM